MVASALDADRPARDLPNIMADPAGDIQALIRSMPPERTLITTYAASLSNHSSPCMGLL